MERTTERTTHRTRTPTVPRSDARPEPDYVEIEVDEHGGLPLYARDRVRWGPILAGLVTALTTLVVLTVLGIALGLAAFEPDQTGTTAIGTAAGLWGAATALLAFLIGGFVAGGAAGVRMPGAGALNGLVMGASAIALMLWLIGSGIGNVLGAAASNIGDLSAVNVTITGDEANTAFANAEEGAWWTLIALGAALFAATLGGWLGELTRMPVGEEPRH